MKIRSKYMELGKSKAERLLCLLFCLMLLGQFVTLSILNLTVLPGYSDYDSSSDFLRAVEMHAQRRILPENWVDTSMLHLDGSVPLAALLMGATHNVFSAYGIANILLTFLLLLAAYSAMRAMGLTPLLRVLGCNMLLCPYMMDHVDINLLNYYTCVLGSAAYYLGVIILMFGCIWLWNSPECRRNPLKISIAVLLCFGTFVSGVSRGIYLAMTCILPALACAVFRRDEGRLARLKWFSAMLVLNFLGKMLAVTQLNFKSLDSIVPLTDGAGVVENIGAILTGWFSLLSAAPIGRTTEVISKIGLVYLAGMAIAIILLGCAVIGSARAVKKVWREEPDGVFLPGILFAWNVAVLLLTSSNYGSVFENRYLLVVFMPAVLCLLLALQEGKADIYLLLTLAIGICVGIRDVEGDKVVKNTAYSTAWMSEVIETANECPSPVVYYISKSDAFQIRYMRPMDRAHTYRNIWSRDGSGVVVSDKWKTGGGWISSAAVFVPEGDSTRFIWADEWDGPVLLIAAEREIELLPTCLQEQFRPVKSLNCGLLVYRAEANVLGLG